MAISATRFKYLDKDTNVPVADFLSVTNSDSLNAAVDNLTTEMLVVPVDKPAFNLEDTVKKGLDDVKNMLDGDHNYTDKLKELSGGLKDYLPDNLDFGQKAVLDNFKGVFNKVANLKASSLCELINMALGISIVGMMFNFSPDMAKRLFMRGLLALLHKMCYTKFNAIDNPSSLIDKDILKGTSKSIFSSMVKPNSLGSVDKFLPSAANPLKRVVNDIKNAPNPFAGKMQVALNPKLTLFA